MSRRSKAILFKAHGIRSERRVVFIVGNPQVGRLRWLGQIPANSMQSDREAVIGGEYFKAEEDEPTASFHFRLMDLARARGKTLVSLGYEPPAPAPAYPAAPVDQTRH